MYRLTAKLAFALVLVGLSASLAAVVLPPYLPGSANLDAVRVRVVPELEQQLRQSGFAFGDPVHIRIFKEPRELELWIGGGARYSLFKTYPICSYSGGLGPKLKEGDRQSPEGFYRVTADRLNPNSNYHLSFNLGFPNAYDRAHRRTGSYLMVHGKCASIGCYAMTDAGIEEIYLLTEAALAAGQQAVDVHIFPFRMTDEKMAEFSHSEWIGFWENLKQGHDRFEAHGVPSSIDVAGRRYVFAEQTALD